MKKLLFFMGLLSLTVTSFSQAGALGKVQDADFGQTDSRLHGLAAKAASAVDCCWEDTCKCSDLKDPWEIRSLSYAQQIQKMSRAGNVASLQQKMAAFEKAVLDGKGKLKLTSEHLRLAFDSHPGYTSAAIKARFLNYMALLQRK